MATTKRTTNRRRRPPKGLHKASARGDAKAIDAAIRTDMKQRPGDGAWGTSPGALGLVKMASEEARHESCFECGFSGGRHSRRCSRST